MPASFGRDGELYQVNLAYKFSLSQAREEIHGAKHLELDLEVKLAGLRSHATGMPIRLDIDDDLMEKLASMVIKVELPEDMQAKLDATAKQKGVTIRNTLDKAIAEMQKMQKAGMDYPEELKKKLIKW